MHRQGAHVSDSRRQDREKKKRQQARRSREHAAKRMWSFNAAERERASWPVERAWVPCPDAWAATGNGVAAIERRQPDGRFAGAFFTICLMEDGLSTSGTIPDCAPGAFAEQLAKLGEHLPPFREGPVEAASAFIWSAYALSVESGRDWNQVPGIKSALSLVPQPPGTPGEWADLLWDKLTSPGLTRVIARAPHPDDLPEGKEVMILTTARFAADQPADRLIKALRKAKPDFEDDGKADDSAHLFALTRPYPKNHWSPLASLGGRQTVGQVEVRRGGADNPATLVVSGKTLSMTCVVIQKLKRITGDVIRLVEVDWKDLDDIRNSAAADAKREL
jgi:hypothetical protein